MLEAGGVKPATPAALLQVPSDMEGGRLELWPAEVTDIEAAESEAAKITIVPQENKIVHFRWGWGKGRKGVTSAARGVALPADAPRGFTRPAAGARLTSATPRRPLPPGATRCTAS
jgi:hypothetical protein